ncbi:MAG: diaminopimelate decarboxylase [Deltaproteobacteria bacterium]|nr:MAG: diaminopimelate decarboxylase [Deltaproteobacteria bacterium]
MHHFAYRDDELYCEEVPVAHIADQVGTPFYLYSHATITRHYHVFDGAFNGLEHLTCFSVKSNSNIAVLRALAREGAGADIVSGGELLRALRAGIPADKIVFSGVGKTPADIELALQSDIFMFNVESLQELQVLSRIAGTKGKTASIAVRINPDIAADTHPYIATGMGENKFGIPMRDALHVYKIADELKHIELSGISCHIGSQLTDIHPFTKALESLQKIFRELREMGMEIRNLNLGGGLGITYDEENPPHPNEYARALKEIIEGDSITLILEPGRVIIGNAGILVTRALYTKSTSNKRFIIVDAAMNDLIRPALYNSFHAVQPVKRTLSGMIKADLVGPVCETGDFFARDRTMPPFEPGDLVALMSAGAYGFSMASNYNSRPRPAEVMVKGGQFSIIREREIPEELLKGESVPAFL